MRKLAWGLLAGFMLLLLLNTHVAAPVSPQAIGFDLWALFLIYLTFLACRKFWQVVVATTDKTAISKVGIVEHDNANDEGEDEHCTTFDLTDRLMEKDYGWDRIDVYSSRYERSNCNGGPPSYSRVYEYTVWGKTVNQRLVRYEVDDFFKTTDKDKLLLVSDAVADEASMKIMDAEDDILYSGPFFADLERPDRRENLKHQINWHEVHDSVVLYALWATKNSRDALIAEVARLNAAFIAVDVAAKKLGGSRKKDGVWYAERMIDELEKLQSPEGLAAYSITDGEMVQQDKILKVLNQVMHKPPSKNFLP